MQICKTCIDISADKFFYDFLEFFRCFADIDIQSVTGFVKAFDVFVKAINSSSICADTFVNAVAMLETGVIN